MKNCIEIPSITERVTEIVIRQFASKVTEPEDSQNVHICISLGFLRTYIHRVCFGKWLSRPRLKNKAIKNWSILSFTTFEATQPSLATTPPPGMLDRFDFPPFLLPGVLLLILREGWKNHFYNIFVFFFFIFLNGAIGKTLPSTSAHWPKKSN